MRVIFIGSVELSRKALEQLIALKVNVVGVATPKESSFNADFANLTDLCHKYGIPYLHVTDINEPEVTGWMQDLSPDVMFCFGFSQLLSEEVLKLAPLGVIGFHPARLPQNRGRHPIVWALVLGLKKTASTFFFMDKGADSGDILSQKDVAITYQDDARSLYNKITQTALRQIKEFMPQLQSKKYKRLKQNHRQANVWRKRGQEDGRIDFRMNSRAIYNLVRGLTRPYVGAHVSYRGQNVKIWKAQEARTGLPNIEYGKVLKVSGGKILVKCSDGAVWLTQHEFKQLPKAGEYVI